MDSNIFELYAAEEGEGLGDDSDDDVALLLQHAERQVRLGVAAKLLPTEARPPRAAVDSRAGVLEARSARELAEARGMGPDDDAAMKQRIADVRYAALSRRSAAVKALRDVRNKVWGCERRRPEGTPRAWGFVVHEPRKRCIVVLDVCLSVRLCVAGCMCVEA